jgi:hypothetical protein
MNIFSKAAYEPYLAPDTIGDPEMFFPIGHLFQNWNYLPRYWQCMGCLHGSKC